MNTGRKKYQSPTLVVYGTVAGVTQQNHGLAGCEHSAKGCGMGDGNSRLSDPLMPFYAWS